LAAVAAGRSRVAVLAGEAGIGKSRLAQACGDRAREQGWTVLRGSCDPHRFEPFHCLGDAMYPLLAEMPPALRRGFAMFDAQAVGGPRIAGQGDLDRRREGFRSVVDVLARAAAAAPVLMVLDDVQWISPDAAAAVGFLLDAAPKGVMVLLCVRDGEVAPGSATSDLLARVQHGHSAGLLELPRLTELGVAELAGAVKGTTLDARECQAAHDIWLCSGGNPFVAGEWALDLLAVRRLGSCAPTWAARTRAEEVDVHDATRLLLNARMAGMASELRGVLFAAATFGPTFSGALLSEVTGDPSLTATALRESERRRVVEPTEEDGTHTFVHALVRESLLAEVSVARRSFFHDRFASVLEAREGPASDWERLLFHSLGAAALRPDRALAHCARAADAALASLGFEAAAHLYRRCLDLAGSGADRSSATQTKVAVRLACLESAGARSGRPVPVQGVSL